jgi:hypothetical protein
MLAAARLVTYSRSPGHVSRCSFLTAENRAFGKFDPLFPNMPFSGETAFAAGVRPDAKPRSKSNRRNAGLGLGFLHERSHINRFRNARRRRWSHCDVLRWNGNGIRRGRASGVKTRARDTLSSGGFWYLHRFDALTIECIFRITAAPCASCGRPIVRAEFPGVQFSGRRAGSNSEVRAKQGLPGASTVAIPPQGWGFNTPQPPTPGFYRISPRATRTRTAHLRAAAVRQNSQPRPGVRCRR